MIQNLRKTKKFSQVRKHSNKMCQKSERESKENVLKVRKSKKIESQRKCVTRDRAKGNVSKVTDGAKEDVSKVKKRSKIMCIKTSTKLPK